MSIHYKDNGHPKPLVEGDEVLVVDDGQGYEGIIEAVYLDNSSMLWYRASFSKKGEDDENDGDDDDCGNLRVINFCIAMAKL